MKRGYLTPEVIIILGLICFFVGAALFANTKLFPKTKTEPISSSTPLPSPKSSVDPTATWKTYSNPTLGIEFKMPENYFVTKEDKHHIVLGWRNTSGTADEVITISKNPADFTNENSYQPCNTDINNNIKNYPCRYVFQEKSPIILDTLGGKKVKYFLILDVLESGLPIYQTTEPPFIEAKNTNAAGGGDPFNQILSTFQFTN